MANFTVHASANLNNLAAQFVTDYATYRDQLEVFGQYWVVVPSPTIQAWLESKIAFELGICAGIKFLQPSQALWYFHRQLNPDLPEISAYDKQAMMLRLFDYFNFLCPEDSTSISTNNSSDDLAPLLNYLAKQTSEAARIQLATRIAGVFDTYLLYRPDWIEYWEEGSDILKDEQLLQQHSWQGILWRMLVKSADSKVHRVKLANVLAKILKPVDLDNTELNNNSLKHPERISIFGVSTLKPQLLKQYGDLSAHLEIKLYWQNPCSEYWADTAPPNSKQAVVSSLGGEEPWLQGNPLLATWGQYGRGFYAQLVDADLLDYDTCASWPADHKALNSLLHTLQERIANNDPQPLPLPAPSTQGHFATKDNSLTIAGHWSRLREVEGLHDYLLHQFTLADAEGRPLMPHEIAVMVPDIDAYAPMIEAVFDSQPAQHRINYQISGATIQNKQLLGAASTLLKLPRGRYPISEILDLLHHPIIRQRFAISEEDYTQLFGWISDAGIHWGLDEQSWLQQGLPSNRLNTLAGGIDRLLMGLALEDEVFEPTVDANTASASFQNTSCYGAAGITALNAELIGKLSQFVDNLTNWRDFSVTPHTMDIWVNTALTHLQNLFAVEGNEVAEFSLFNRGLQRLIALTESAKFQSPISLEVFLQLLEPILDAGKESKYFQLGKLTLGSFSATRGIPYRVIAILGMNDTDFPRRQERDGIDLTESSFRLGDRSAPAEDRFTFLQALMSAQNAFYCSFISRNIRTAEPRQASLMISELLDYLEPDREQQHTWITQHPIQAFSEVYFINNQQGLFTYADLWQRFVDLDFTTQKNEASTNVSNKEPVNIQWQAPKTLDMEVLKRLVLSPADAFFYSQFNFTFPAPQDSVEDDEPFELNSLLKWQMKEQSVWFEPQNKNRPFLKWQAKGQIPQGPGIAKKLEDISESAERIRSNLLSLIGDTARQTQAVTIDISYGVNSQTVQLQGEVDLYFSATKNQYYHIISVNSKASNVKAKYRMQVVFYAAVTREMVLQDIIPNCRSIIVCEDNCFRFIEAPEHETSMLTTWFELYQQAMQYPTPVNASILDQMSANMTSEKTSKEQINTDNFKLLHADVVDALLSNAPWEVSPAVHRIMAEPLANYYLQNYLQYLTISKIPKKGNNVWEVLELG